MNYKIIHDPTKLKEFISWLPDLKPHETYYVMLMARDKYFPNLGTGAVKLKRFTSQKKDLYNKIEQLECLLGTYEYEGQPIPNDALVLYIMPNPRSQIKSTKRLLKQMLDLILDEYNGYNIHQEALTSLQKSPSNMKFMDFDFDHTTLDDMKPRIETILNPECINYVETRGGFHLLVEIEKISSQYKKNYYNNIMKLPNVDAKGDELCPCPGTIQGGFVPKLII